MDWSLTWKDECDIFCISLIVNLFHEKNKTNKVSIQ